MSTPPKAPVVYRPTPPRLAAPPVYRPNQASAPSAQLKPANNLRLEKRPAPAVYRPQQTMAAGVQAKTANATPQAFPTPHVYRPLQPGMSPMQQKPHTLPAQPRWQHTSGRRKELEFKNTVGQWLNPVVPAGNIQRKSDRASLTMLAIRFRVVQRSENSFEALADLDDEEILVPGPRREEGRSSVGPIGRGDGELRLQLTVKRPKKKEETFLAKVSQQKHLVSSYFNSIVTAGPSPAGINTNTIAVASTQDFEGAFTEYVTALGRRMVSQGKIDPSAPANQISTSQNITFHSDSTLEGLHTIHSYPVGGAKTIVLTNAQFTAVRDAMNIMNGGAANPQGAYNALDAVKDNASVRAFFACASKKKAKWNTPEKVLAILNGIAETRAYEREHNPAGALRGLDL